MFKSLQVCRFLAGILIVLFHLGGAFGADKYFGAQPLARALSFGHHSVILFFVLSGFLIVWMHWDDMGKPERLLRYIRKRTLRIYPSYWIVWLSVYSLAHLSPSLSQTVPHDVTTIVKSLLLLPQDPQVVGGTGAPVLIVTWSLQYEIVFYGIVACFIVNRWIGYAVVSLLAANYLNCSWGGACSFPRSFVGNNYLLPFVCGAIAALLARKVNRFKDPVRLVIATIAVISLLRAIDVFFDIRLFLEDDIAIYGVLSALLIFALVSAEQQGKLKVKPYWDTLAGSSYALFLIHFPLISIFCKFAVAIGVGGTVGIALAFVIALALCVASGLVFYIYFERPMLNLFAGRARILKSVPVVASKVTAT
jgi:peptidoglycan/LPS O-acetylase OafA/YrhL